MHSTSDNQPRALTGAGFYFRFRHSHHSCSPAASMSSATTPRNVTIHGSQ
jgi:hypothetical protein